MMSAQECQDRADALSRSAAECNTLSLSLRLEAIAEEWRKLADFAHRQDTLILSLATANDVSSGVEDVSSGVEHV